MGVLVLILIIGLIIFLVVYGFLTVRSNRRLRDYQSTKEEIEFEDVEADDAAYRLEIIGVGFEHGGKTATVYMQRWQEEEVWERLPLELKLKQAFGKVRPEDTMELELEDGTKVVVNKPGKSEAAKDMVKFINRLDNEHGAKIELAKENFKKTGGIVTKTVSPTSSKAELKKWFNNQNADVQEMFRETPDERAENEPADQYLFRMAVKRAIRESKIIT